jgi:tRNA (cmo5U34)-methyltransferase
VEYFCRTSHSENSRLTEISHGLSKLDLVFNKEQDRVFSSSTEPYTAPFSFSKEVCDVFDDMALRSIPLYREMLLTQAYWITQITHPGDTFYDLGCSTGSAIVATLSMLSKGHNLNIVGVDSSDEMIIKAKDKIERFQNSSALGPSHSDCKIGFYKASLVDYELRTSAFISLNYVLQFIDTELRQQIVNRVFRSLRKGGTLFLSEKIIFENPRVQSLMTLDYENFKLNNGYSREEVLRKKKSLEGFLVSLTDSENVQMLKNAGFSSVDCVLRKGPFTSWVAVK